jgi:GNAT superfamily N-acetyltransferase
MPIQWETVPRAGAGELIDALKRWAPPHCYVAGLHAGDIGWELRLADEEGDSALLAVRDGDELVAVALADSPVVLRPLLRPDLLQDLQVAAALLEYVEAMPRDSAAYTDAASGSAFRSLLSASGWQLDPDPWVALYRPLTETDGEHVDAWSSTLESPHDVADRVAVQRSAFQGSTFTVDRWHQMAAGPGFDPAFELLRRDKDGRPVAAATGWSAGAGKCAILEPVGTHREHTGAGHGKAVSLAVIATLARGGASGVTVHTPASNAAAVRTYESCGLRQVELTQAMTRPAT